MSRDISVMSNIIREMSSVIRVVSSVMSALTTLDLPGKQTLGLRYNTPVGGGSVSGTEPVHGEPSSHDGRHQPDAAGQYGPHLGGELGDAVREVDCDKLE